MNKQYVQDIKTKYNQRKILMDLNRSRGTALITLSATEKTDILQYYKKHGFHVNTAYHQLYYTVTGIHDYRFLPDWIMYTSLITKLNDRRMMTAWADKAYIDLHLPNCTHAHILVRNINGVCYDHQFNPISFAEANRIINTEETIIIKPSIDSGGGAGICVYQSPVQIEDLVCKHPKNYVIQRLVKQDETVSAFNESSVNTIRIITLNWNRQIHICGQMLRIGETGAATDNVSHGQAISVGLDKHGMVSRTCYSGNGLSYQTFDRYILPEDHHVNGVQEAREMVTEAHKHLPYFGIVAWDVAIDKDGHPVLLEYNVRAIGIKNFQYNNGPIFGDLTDEVLDYIRS